MSFERIYIVHTEDPKNEDSTTDWYWSQDEAEREYDRLTTFEDYEVTLYSGDVRQTIQDYVDGEIGSGANGLNELRSNRQAPEPVNDVTWGELEFRPNGEFYIERLKASTHEYWPYTVESYGDFGTNDRDGWRVIDATTQVPIGIVRPGTQNECFKAVVNGYAQPQNFINLKAAVIHIATEYNGI